VATVAGCAVAVERVQLVARGRGMGSAVVKGWIQKGACSAERGYYARPDNERTMRVATPKTGRSGFDCATAAQLTATVCVRDEGKVRCGGSGGRTLSLDDAALQRLHICPVEVRPEFRGRDTWTGIASLRAPRDAMYLL
jgi:hypothetical protein